jgi:hypothetical protein
MGAFMGLNHFPENRSRLPSRRLGRFSKRRQNGSRSTSFLRAAGKTAVVGRIKVVNVEKAGKNAPERRFGR